MARPQAPVGAPKTPTPDEDYRTRLLALRDRLEGRITECGDRELAPLAARYVDVLDRVAALPEIAKAGDVVDDLTARRARGAAAPRPKRPATG